ncbi:hypothetical protein GCM10011385_02990 [Nitratireductor aestuarii]|uniref:DUF2065 domain-containing protein n=1 Tax=Nitratireductor aestuarii TaxID=1735103 RepID=A0A916VYT6_9HYPH|nr:DUF2065 family protein [Nitratireductor aestuarii]GGA53005.1 hypothetical protein GCM10011385_02990 [Nitratireductor aestuarii]
MNDFLSALGLMLVLEGLLYGGLPGLVKRMAADIMHVPEGVMRVIGLMVMAFGVFIVWLVRG